MEPFQGSLHAIQIDLLYMQPRSDSGLWSVLDMTTDFLNVETSGFHLWPLIHDR